MSRPVVSSRRRYRPRAPRTLPPWMVLTASLLLTVLLTWATAAAARARDQIRFERAAVQARQRVASRLEVYIALLRGTAGLLAARPEITRAEFEAYVDLLEIPENYPGVQGLGLSLRVDSGDVAALETRMRREGIPGFRIRPDSARPEFHAIVFLSPMDRRNRVAIGYDMFTEPVRREAMQRARDSSAVAMSGPVTLVQEIAAPRQAGFLIYLPVYRGGTVPATTAARRDSLRGFVYAPFRSDDLFAGIFGATLAPDVHVRIFDGGALKPGRLLHDSRGPQPPAVTHSTFVDTLRLAVAGREWTMVVTPAPAFAEGRRAPLAPVVALLGVIVSIALFALARARRRAVLAIAEAHDLFGRVLEQAPVAICVLRGPRHVFEVANPPYRRLLAVDPIGLPVAAAIPEAEAQGFVATLDRVYESGIPWVGHGVHLVYDRASSGSGDPAYFNVLYYPFKRSDGSTDGVIAVVVDVTAEVTARNDAEVARKEAEQANRAKSDFLAAMSHELRTPLNAIAGYAQLIEMGVHGPVTTSQREALARVQRSASHLLSLINDVLNFAKLEAGRVEFKIEDVNLRGVVADVVHMIEPQLEVKQLTCQLDVPADITVSADEEKLRQILLNLLSNAVKFTQEGGIAVHTSRPDGGEARAVALHVRDTGIGIPEDRCHVVFDPFVQVHRGLTQSTEGTGLGLAISQDLARGMNAELSVQSVVGVGSTFTLTMPAAE